MNSSGNLISLSDSGVGPSLSASLGNLIGLRRDASFTGSAEFLDVGEAKSSSEATKELESTTSRENASSKDAVDTGTGLLIDFSDEIQVPMAQGILLQAEIDDTFGIFSMAQQSSQGTASSDAHSENGDGEDDASKLVRSFTLGRTSDKENVKKKDTESEVDVNLPNQTEVSKHDHNEDTESNNESVESISSDQPTIVESDGSCSPKTPLNEEDEGVMNQKMDLTSTSNFSGGSDSEILDVQNLSSFSIPDEELDDDKFIEDIRRKDMASSSVTTAVVNKIKLQMRESDDEEEHRSRSITVERYACFSDTKHSAMTTSESCGRNARPSLSSMPSRRLSASHQQNSTIIADITSTTGTRSRLSTSNFGSPIRTSYPVSRYFMPTPAKISANHGVQLSDSFYSPSQTRVMLITGDSHRSPAHVPVRKSISAETLHYEYNSPVKETRKHIVKFSTPAASNKSRHSFGNHSGYPNFFGDSPVTEEEQQPKNAYNYRSKEALETSRTQFTHYRSGRLSYASSASNSSINTLNTSASSIYPCPGSAARGITATATVQPIRATAVIAPTNLTKPTIKAPINGVNKNGSFMPSSKQIPEKQGPIRPIAASSPNIIPTATRSVSNHTTPTRSRYGMNVRSSGYGAQQNLNSTFGANNPLKSPNKAATSTSANIKPPAIPKSLKPGIPTIGSKLELGARGGGSTTIKSGIAAMKHGGKLPVPGSIGLRRPAATAVSSTFSGSNKENKLRPGTTTATSRIAQKQANR